MADTTSKPNTIHLLIDSQYGRLSRGRHSARQGSGDSATWAKKTDSGDLLITESGVWALHCSDGFNRTARATLKVSRDGSWSLTGDQKRFFVTDASEEN